MPDERAAGRSHASGDQRAPRQGDARAAAEAWESLFRAQVALMRRFQRDDIWRELSMREYDVLFTLSGAPGSGARLRELGEGSLLSQPSLSRMVERLEAAGLVAREPAPDDARGVVVRLTDAGRARQRELGRAHVRQIERYVGGALDAAELASLRELTEKLRVAQAELE